MLGHSDSEGLGPLHFAWGTTMSLKVCPLEVPLLLSPVCAISCPCGMSTGENIDTRRY